MTKYGCEHAAYWSNLLLLRVPVVQWSTKGQAMGVNKQSVSFTDPAFAFAFARELVERGEYPNVSAAVSGEMARAKAARENEWALFAAEVQRRLALPLDQWEPVGGIADFTAEARKHLAKIAARCQSAADSAK